MDSSEHLNFQIGTIFPKPSSQNKKETDNWNGLNLWLNHVKGSGGITYPGGAIRNISLATSFVSIDGYVLHNNTEAIQEARALCQHPSISVITCPDRLAVECVHACSPLEKVQLLFWKDDKMCSGPTDDFGNEGDNVFCVSLRPEIGFQGAMKQTTNYGYQKAATLWLSENTLTETEGGTLKPVAEENGLEVVLDSSFSRTSIAAELEAADHNGAEALFISSSNSTLDVIQQLKLLDYTPAVVWASGAPEEESWLTEAGQDGDYIMTTKQWHHKVQFEDDIFGSAEEYANLYLDTYGEYPSEDAALGTMVGLSLHHAVSDSYGETDVDALVDGLLGLNLDTMFGRIRFNENQRNTGRDLLTLQWQSQGTSGDEAIALQVILPVIAASATWVHPLQQWGCRPGATQGVCDELFGVTSITSGIFIGLSWVGLLFTSALLFFMIRFRKRGGFAVSGVPFVAGLLIGGLLAFLAMMTFAVDPAESTGELGNVCLARLWVTGIAAFIGISTLLSKPLLLVLLKRRRLSREYPPLKEQCLFIFCPFFLGLALLALWTALDTPVYKEQQVNGVGYRGCSSSPDFLWLVTLYILILTFAGTILSWMTKKLPSVFNEAKMVYFAFVAVFFVLLLMIIVLQALNHTPDSFAIISCLGMAFITFTVLGLVLSTRYYSYLKGSWRQKYQAGDPQNSGVQMGTSGSFALKSGSNHRLIAEERTRPGLRAVKKVHANAITSLEQAIPEQRGSLEKRNHTII